MSRTAGPTAPLTQVLVEFAHTLGTDFSVQDILDHLVRRVADIVPVTGAGVMLIDDRRELHFVAASDDVVLRIEALQNELKEGPCLHAFSTGESVAIDDLTVDERFPRFSPRAAADGLAAVFTFPLRLDAQRLGALDLYRDRPGPLAQPDLEAAQVVADVAAAYLFNAQARLDASATVAHLQHLNLHDALTGLPNRTLLEELLERAVARSSRSRTGAAVLFADIDHFKAVNDQYGHHVGDQLLVAFAHRLSQVLRPGDTLARLGGDEFVVLCEDLDDGAQAEAVAARIRGVLVPPFQLGHHRVAVTASVGVAFSGPGADIPQALLRDADLAMYQAKSMGGGSHHVLDPSWRLAVDRRDELEHDLRGAAGRGELTLVFQPVIDLRTACVVELEALLRWDHPSRGLVPTASVIAAAERTGMMPELGEWVLGQACRDLCAWDAAGIDVPAVSVNVSPSQLLGSAFTETVASVLSRTGVASHRLTLELTERCLVNDVPRTRSVMAALRELGVRLALDDFGRDQASLHSLQGFPLDEVKIDGGLVAAAGEEVAGYTVSAVAALAHLLDLTVTAEGVEGADELALVRTLGVDRAQGYHLCRPLAPVDLDAYLLLTAAPQVQAG